MDLMNCTPLWVGIVQALDGWVTMQHGKLQLSMLCSIKGWSGSPKYLRRNTRLCFCKARHTTDHVNFAVYSTFTKLNH